MIKIYKIEDEDDNFALSDLITVMDSIFNNLNSGFKNGFSEQEKFTKELSEFAEKNSPDYEKINVDSLHELIQDFLTSNGNF